MTSKVWLCEMLLDGAREFLAAFKTEELGLQEAAYLMVDEITHRWDMSNKEEAEAAQKIYNKIKVGHHYDTRIALRDFNEFLAARCGRSITVMYTVNYDQADTIIELDDSFFGLDDDEEEASEEEIEDDKQQAVIATGATCSKCKTYNEFAAPQTADGMYCCRSCTVFINIFSQEN